MEGDFMLRRNIAQALLAAATGSAAIANRTEAQASSAPRYARTAAEVAAQVTPSDTSHPPGTPERYGAVGDGVHDDTGAMTSMISCNSSMTFGPAKTYAVVSIAFPYGRDYFVNFNGSVIRGIADTPTTCVVCLQMQGSTFIGYSVEGHNGVSNPNMHYTCGTWWYNPAHGSQFNTFFGMRHTHLVRGMIFGALPGQTSTSVPQSENSIYGWRTRGVQNPFYSNSAQGFLHFADPIFVSLNEEWSGGFDFSAARALEIYAGNVLAQGGEIQIASSTSGYAADLQACTLVGMNVETASPIQIIGDAVQIIGGQFTVNVDSEPAFKIKRGVHGVLSLNDVRFGRAATLGSYSASPIVDATSAPPTFETYMCGTQSFEWRWNLVGGDARLVQGGRARFRNHRMSITASDPNVYVLDTHLGGSLLDTAAFDALGYTMRGWHLNVDYGAGTTLSNTALAGPSGYLASQLTLDATGGAAANIADTSSLAAIQSSCIHVTPTDLYWISCWVNIIGGGNAKLTARFFNLSGTLLQEAVIADSGAISSGAWKFVEGPLSVPAGAAYMAPGITGIASRVAFTDLRVRRAS
jgi:hypothetical protein